MQKLKEPPPIPSIFPESSSPSPCFCSIPWVMPKGLTGRRQAAARAAGSIWAVADATNSMLVKVCLEGDAFPTAINVLQQLTLPGLLCRICHQPCIRMWGWPLPVPKLMTPLAFLLCRTGKRLAQKRKGYPGVPCRVTGSERSSPSPLLQGRAHRNGRKEPIGCPGLTSESGKEPLPSSACCQRSGTPGPSPRSPPALTSARFRAG